MILSLCSHRPDPQAALLVTQISLNATALVLVRSVNFASSSSSFCWTSGSFALAMNLLNAASSSKTNWAAASKAKSCSVPISTEAGHSPSSDRSRYIRVCDWGNASPTKDWMSGIWTVSKWDWKAAGVRAALRPKRRRTSVGILSLCCISAFSDVLNHSSHDVLRKEGSAPIRPQTIAVNSFLSFFFFFFFFLFKFVPPKNRRF